MDLRDKIFLNQTRAIFDKKEYKFFSSKKPFNINIVGVRSSVNKSNYFDDSINVIYRDDSLQYVVKSFVATTDPGKYWLENPMNVDGALILPPGQYRSLWKIGKHRGKYAALVQNKPVRVWRDSNLDNVIDRQETESEPGLWGLNCHRSNPQASSYLVSKWSAGCQVFSNPKQFKEFMSIVKKSAKLYGDGFSYTLLEEKSYMEKD